VTDLPRLLDAVRDRDVRFASVAPPDRETLERRIVVVSPPELVELTGTGDVEVLDRLVDLLGVPGRAWAAQVALTAMTRRDERLVESDRSAPERWLEGPVGGGARARWAEWLAGHRDRLRWDPEIRAFVPA
jgi:hypothetical protein